MVFFVFGPNASSWAIGNERFAMREKLPQPLNSMWDEMGKIFQDKSMVGSSIDWISTGPDGAYFLKKKDGMMHCNRPDLLEAIKRQQQENCYLPPSVEHVSFSPYGAWFIRYNHGIVQLSSQGRFPDTFLALVSPYLTLSGPAASQAQQSSLTDVFFGYQDAVVICVNGGMAWDKLSNEMATQLKAFGYQYSLGPRTALSPWTNGSYFLEAVPIYGTSQYVYDLPPDTGLTPDVVKSIIAGNRPEANLIKPPATPSKPPVKPTPAPAHVPTNPPKPPPRPSQVQTSPSTSHIPDATRIQYENQFHGLCGTKSYLTGMQAANIFTATGVDEAELSRIWDITDQNHDGRFQIREFVLAMWMIKQHWTYTNPPPSNSFRPQTETTTSPPEEKNDENISTSDQYSRKFGDDMLKSSLLSSIVSEKSNVKWEDVAGLEAAKEELQQAIIFPIRFPQLFTGRRKARKAMLLYGVPGTGKSYLAKAIATEIDHTLFSISSSDITSKWIGESESLMRQLFKLAREKKPSIIFMDEIDAICGARDGPSGGNNENTARMKTEFLVQMDGVGNDNEGVLVLAATNLPWSLDPAVRRRFQKSIHIPLPDMKARQQLFKITVGDIAPDMQEGDFEWLAKNTEGFSGSDIAIAVQDALMLPIKKVQMAQYFKELYSTATVWYTPCEANDRGAVKMSWKDVPPKQLMEPKLTAQDFFSVLQNVKPSVGVGDIQKCTEWTKQYGLEGA